MNIRTPLPIGIPDIETPRWRIDPSRSSIEFHAPNLWGLVTVKGRFERYDGTLDLSAAPAVELTIEAASLDTSSAKRDKHLRSGDFFDVEHHELVRFTSETAELDGDRLNVRGRLSAAGKAILLELETTVRRDGDDLVLDATALADHRQLGMTWGARLGLRSPSRVIVHARLTQDAAELGR